ncbi:anti-sigma regulatory factor (Ser/Thr protein kinase) [Streptomyces aurantiacus]|uniref:ATP-binding protein n=1 Tax=Streptomyces aurantiacus TaxID=47760 RepID=UPI002794178F|nr:ATP-binding protein [Streptomyces aurantiacus]MDQ0773728.1 anti-sigma regulatory factor (Ser/Thr protein kinase) [Streptomyces aurantiacus]
MAPPSLPKPLGRLPADGHPHRTAVFGLPPELPSVGLARRNVRELLTAWGTDTEACDNAVLVTSELVTNALTHTVSERIICRLRSDGHGLHLEVEDQKRCPTIPAQRTAGPDEQGGRGLMLVGMLSSDWGVRDTAHGSGRVVWAVLPARPIPSPQSPEPRELAPAEFVPVSPELVPATHLTRPAPHSAEGSLPHGTAARP